MSASLALVALKRPDPTYPPGEVGLTATACMPGTCEQAAVTCGAVATEVLAASCTTTHCWPSAALNLAQPLSRPAAASAHAAKRTRVVGTAPSLGRMTASA